MGRQVLFAKDVFLGYICPKKYIFMSIFRDWTRDKLKERFGLKRVPNHPILLDWLEQASPIEVDAYEEETLRRWREQMLLYVDYWSEDELKMKFIGNIITLVNYDTEELSAFANRALDGTVDGEYISGIPDFMVARGKQEVKSPFFCLHEYKKELDNNSPDPAAQCLVAMLVAQQKNLDTPQMAGKPLYGSYVIGRNWFFLILDGLEYSISKAFDATDSDDLIKVLKVLKVCKNKIFDIWEKP